MDTNKHILFIKKHKAFLRDWTWEKCLWGKPVDIVTQYCAEIYGVPLCNFTNPHGAFVAYPMGPFNHLRKRTFNDQQEPDHAPKIGDIAIWWWSKNYSGIVVEAEPWDTGISILTQVDWECQIINKSYDELVWRMTNIYHEEYEQEPKE